MITFDDAMAELRRGFAVPAEALDRCEAILDLQLAALAARRPIDRLPESVRIAAASRLRSGEIVIPRERVPVEPHSVARLVRALARGVLDDSAAFEDAAVAFVEAALPPATVDDGRGVRDVAVRLGLAAEPATALLREGLKPDMLRTSEPFRALVAGEPRGGRCPLCGELPCGGTQSGALCCRWCGLIWPWHGGVCPSCASTELRPLELTAIVRNARFQQCAKCGEVVKLFATVADPLVISLHVVLTAPFDLAARVRAGAEPGEGFAVF